MYDSHHTLIIVASLVTILATYIFFSRRVGNYVNILLPAILFMVPACFLFELVHGFLFGYEQSEFSYFYCYLAYTAAVIAQATGYMITPNVRIRIFPKLRRFPFQGSAWIFLGIGIALYMPILMKFPDLILNPRRIYQLTRNGFGIEFFLSTFAVYFGLILLFFSAHVRRKRLAVFSVLALAILYLHGSKGQLLYLMLIGLYYGVFVLNWRFGLGRAVVVGTVVSVLVLALFWITFPATLKAEFLVSLANYSDYSRNAAMTIDDPTLDPQLGRLSAEASFYSFIPRALFPEKPTVFGAFWLVERYYPQAMQESQGAPAFGFGLLYADFGVFSIPYYILTEFISGVMLKILVFRLRERADAGTFLLLLPLMDVALIAADPPYVLYYPFALLARVLSRDRQRLPEAVAADVEAPIHPPEMLVTTK